MKSYPLVNLHQQLRNITIFHHHFFMAKSTISMAIFNSSVKYYQRVDLIGFSSILLCPKTWSLRMEPPGPQPARCPVGVNRRSGNDRTAGTHQSPCSSTRCIIGCLAAFEEKTRILFPQPFKSVCRNMWCIPEMATLVHSKNRGNHQILEIYHYFQTIIGHISHYIILYPHDTSIWLAKSPIHSSNLQYNLHIHYDYNIP